MRFQIDHDFHMHSHLSLCSADPAQTTEALLAYAEENGLKKIVITDHFWDEDVYKTDYSFYRDQPYTRIRQSLPLPQSEQVRFCFGGETDMDQNDVLGVTAKAIEEMDFLIIPTTHQHLYPFTIAEDLPLERRAERYVERLDRVLSIDLPFYKIGIAHPTCQLLAPTNWQDHLTVLDMIEDSTYRELYGRMAKLGAGFEVNFNPASYTEEDLPRVLRPFRIAKEVGCRFYLGSDTHHPADTAAAPARFRRCVELLKLTEADKFDFSVK